MNRWYKHPHIHTYIHGLKQTHTLAHTHNKRTHRGWWKCYLSIFQLNVLISLVAHGCLGKQQSQLQKAESIHLRGCQSGRRRAEVSAQAETHCSIIFSRTHSTWMLLHTSLPPNVSLSSQAVSNMSHHDESTCLNTSPSRSSQHLPIGGRINSLYSQTKDEARYHAAKPPFPPFSISCCFRVKNATEGLSVSFEPEKHRAHKPVTISDV